MILVALGTQDKSFVRILEMVEKLLDEKIINEEVYVQAGYTKFESKYMKIFDYLDMDEYERLLKECDILISHGGVGTIVSAIKDGKKVIGVPRLAMYHEHHNDHQLEIIENFTSQGYILSANNVEELASAIEKIKTFKPNEFVSNNERFVALIRKEIMS